MKSGADKTCLTYKGDSPYNLTSSTEIQILLEGVAFPRVQAELPILPSYLKNLPLQIPPVHAKRIKKMEMSQKNYHLGTSTVEGVVDEGKN